MHRALMYLQYKQSPPSVEQSEQVHRAMRFTEQQCPRRGQRSRVEVGHLYNFHPGYWECALPVIVDRHQARENNHLV